MFSLPLTRLAVFPQRVCAHGPDPADCFAGIGPDACPESIQVKGCPYEWKGWIIGLQDQGHGHVSPDPAPTAMNERALSDPNRAGSGP